MLLSSALRECCTRHLLQRTFCYAQKCVKSLNFRGLATSRSQLFVRRSHQRFVIQTRGAKTHRQKQQQEEEWKQKNKTILTYIAAAGVGMIGMSYAAVPLYRLYCQVSAECHMALIYCWMVGCKHHYCLKTTCLTKFMEYGWVTNHFVPQASGLGGTAVAGHDTDLVETMTPVRERIIKVTFNADTHASLQWNFRPQQSEIYVCWWCIIFCF